MNLQVMMDNEELAEAIDYAKRACFYESDSTRWGEHLDNLLEIQVTRAKFIVAEDSTDDPALPFTRQE